MSICKPMYNTGTNECGFNIAPLRRIEIVPTFDESGDTNSFATTALVTKTALQAKFDAALSLDRFYPLPVAKSNVITPGEDTIFTAPDKSTDTLSEGKDKYEMRYFRTHPLFVRALKGFKGQDIGFHGWDADGNMWYQTDVATGKEVHPIPIDPTSVTAKFVKGVEEEPDYVLFSFTLNTSASDEEFRFIPADELDFNGLLSSDVYALRDVEVVYTDISTTGFTANLTTKMGDQVTGLDTNPTTGDLADLYNNDTTSAIVPTSITETPAASGIYVFVYTAQTSGNKLTLTPTRSKYSFTDVIAAEILTP